MERAWMIRAGRDGERVTDALESRSVIVGWEEVPDLAAVKSRPDLKALIAETFPDASPIVIGNWAGQLWRFKDEIAEGDLVVMPLPERKLAIGRISGPYQFEADADPGMRHRRAVKWGRVDLSRDDVRHDLRDSMGSLLTIFELSRYDAPIRIRAMLEGSADPGPLKADDESAIGSPTLLEERVRTALADGDTLQITVRELLAIWGHAHRWPAVINQISAELEELGLVSRPPFETENINALISIVPVGVEPRRGESVPTATELPEEVARDDKPVTLLIKQLSSAKSKIVSVRPEDDLQTATTLMTLHDFDQLPVLDNKGWLLGAVTWKSIGRARMSADEPTVVQAAIQAVEVRGDDDLLRVIDTVGEEGFIVVRDAENRATGVVTTSDLTSLLGNQLTPFLLVAEIERRLRRIIGRALESEWITLEKISELTNGFTKKAKSPNDFSLGNYPYIFESPELWAASGWKIDRDILRDRLEATARFRNDLMHLNPDVDATDTAGLAPLHGLLALLKGLDQD